MRAQSYASEGHGTIHGNLARLIGNHLAATRPECRVVIEGGVIPVFDPKRNVRKPDLTVSCTPHVKGSRAVKYPILVIEILSPSNESETWESAQACATVGSVTEIVMIESEAREAKNFTKDARGNWSDPWATIEARGTIRLSSIDLELTMADVYRGTELDE